MSTETAARPMRIGEVAELTGTTPRTIRYYEELGLFGSETPREQGKHRCYTDADVDQINEIVRLKELLGLSLEQLKQVVEAQAARAEVRAEYRVTEDPARRRELLLESSRHIETQLSLVRGRQTELRELEQELSGKLEHIADKIEALAEL
jgi:MerR family transcriptional regulator, repressor of the yfmOP operon